MKEMALQTVAIIVWEKLSNYWGVGESLTMTLKAENIK